MHTRPTTPPPAQIHFLILMSRQGKVRLAKWYSTYNQKERAKTIKETTALVLSRPLRLCNFVDWRGVKLIYKRYASLYFVCGVDPGDNELITLEVIHEFVEVGAGGAAAVWRNAWLGRGWLLGRAVEAWAQQGTAPRAPGMLACAPTRALTHSPPPHARRCWTATLATCASWTSSSTSTRPITSWMSCSLLVGAGLLHPG